ncbi:MAG TPA: methyltransferase domain-containing protein [Burkholderiales bacterium]|jgi:protein-L-isoaspartate O-methyltransferase
MTLRAIFLPALLLAAPAALAQDLLPSKNAGPYVPSPESVVSDMLKVAQVGPNDFIIDLGSGDGRIVLTAAKVFGARGFGVEIKDELVQKANQAAKAQGIADRVRFVKQDLFKTDISQATVLTMYLLPDTVNLLKDKLLNELKPGTRVISHDYPLTGWLPQDYKQFDLQEKVAISGVTTTLIYLYIVPAKVQGRWTATMPPAVSRNPVALDIRQQITRISGSATIDGRQVMLDEPEIEGDRMRFKLLGRKDVFSGQVKGKLIEGQVDSGGRKASWMATLGG